MPRSHETQTLYGYFNLVVWACSCVYHVCLGSLMDAFKPGQLCLTDRGELFNSDNTILSLTVKSTLNLCPSNYLSFLIVCMCVHVCACMWGGVQSCGLLVHCDNVFAVMLCGLLRCVGGDAVWCAVTMCGSNVCCNCGFVFAVWCIVHSDNVFAVMYAVVRQCVCSYGVWLFVTMLLW